MDTFSHFEWEDQDLQRWTVPLLLTGACLGVGAAFTLAPWVVNASKHPKVLSDTTRLVPKRAGTSIGWGMLPCAGESEREATGNQKIHRSMSSIGRFALRSQTKRNPSIISFFVAFSNEKGTKEIDLDEFGKLVQDRVMTKHERFRSRVDAKDDHYFEVMDDINMHNFISRSSHPTDKEELASRVHDYLTSTFEVRERLWEAQISTGPMGASGAIREELAAQLMDTHDRETVVVFRVHHALCDGVSLSIATGDLCDEADDLDAAMLSMLQKRRKQTKKRGFTLKLVHFFRLLLFWIVGSVYALSLQFWRTLVSVNPFEQVMAARGDQDSSRSTTWRHVASVDEIKQVAKSISKKATVNDLMVACLTGALYRQLAEHEKVLKASGVTLKIPSHLNVVVPVHLHGGVHLKGEALGNKIGAFVTAIPARGKLSPQGWLKQVSSNLMEGKTTPAALIAWSIAKFFSDFAPLKVSKWAIRKGNGHASVVVSNVRGFPFTTHWNGRRLEHLSAFLPLPPGVPVGIVVSSYDGSITFTVEAEKRAVPDADRFADWVLEEFETLKTAALKHG